MASEIGSEREGNGLDIINTYWRIVMLRTAVCVCS